jgi:hypothetical protein
MVVDARQHIGKEELRVETGELGRLDERHRVGDDLTASIGAGEEEVFPSEGNRTQRAFGGIVVNGHPAIIEEQREGWPAVERVSDRLGEIALAGDPRQLLLAPIAERLGSRPALTLANR